MKEIKRYDLQKCSYGADLFKRPNGKWVKYEDVKQLLETVESLKEDLLEKLLLMDSNIIKCYECGAIDDNGKMDHGKNCETKKLLDKHFKVGE